MPRLEAKIALITGASRGIGQAIAELFAAQGARVILTDINDQMGQQVALKIGNQAEYMHLDVAQEEHWLTTTNILKEKYGIKFAILKECGLWVSGLSEKGTQTFLMDWGNKLFVKSKVKF